MNTETNKTSPENLQQRLQHDAERIAVNVDDNFSQRVSNQLHPRTDSSTASPGAGSLLRPWMGWGLATATALVLAVIVGRESLTPDSPPIDQPLVANLELNLDKALANREDDLRTELQKVQNDLQRVESMLGLGGKTFSK